MTQYKYKRVTIVVLDSLGIGAMPDADEWGDAGADTLGHILETSPVVLPNLARLGLGNIRTFAGVAPSPRPQGAYGRCALKSNGKDTTVGHWEIAGIILDKAFPTYPEGFPDTVINNFIESARVPGALGNCAASGTEIIARLGVEHVLTGKPIVYTSADSVFQIAAHEDVISIERLYEICAAARGVLHGEHEVARVIARPFVGNDGDFRRTERRRDYAIPPPRPNINIALQEAGFDVVSVGKVSSVFDDQGFTNQINAKNNDQAIDGTVQALGKDTHGFIFANLVDFDMLYGHRRDVAGYARALAHFDTRLPEIEAAMRDDDLLIITADHGNDPTHKGSDHTREYTPLLVTGAHVASGVNLGTRRTLADIGQTIAENFDVQLNAGESFLRDIIE